MIFLFHGLKMIEQVYDSEKILQLLWLGGINRKANFYMPLHNLSMRPNMSKLRHKVV